MKPSVDHGNPVAHRPDGRDPAALISEITSTGAPDAGLAEHPLPPRSTASGTLRRLQEEALRQFAARGFHAVSIRDLAAAVGIHPSSVYSHVSSKNALLADLIRLGHTEHRDRLRHALLECGADPGEQIAALMTAHVRVHAEYPLLTRVANRELGSLSGAAHAEVAAVRMESERLFMDVVIRGQRMGVFAAEINPMLAVAAIGAMGIRIAEWWRPSLNIGIDELASTYARFARNMLG